MNAVVLELKDGKAAVLDHLGRVSIIPDKAYTVGQQLEISEEQLQAGAGSVHVRDRRSKTHGRWLYRHLLPVAACLVAMLLAGGGITAYAMPCSTVTLDINPSVEYSLNIFSRVLSVKALNGDGTEIVTGLQSSIQGRTITDAVSMTLTALQKADYIENADTPVIFSVESIGNGEKELEASLLTEVSDWNSTQNEGTVKATAITVTADLKKEAEEKNVSPGKLYLTDQLKEEILKDSGFDENEWLQKSVKEVQDATQQDSAAGQDSSMQQPEQNAGNGQSMQQPASQGDAEQKKTQENAAGAGQSGQAPPSGTENNAGAGSSQPAESGTQQNGPDSQKLPENGAGTAQSAPSGSALPSPEGQKSGQTPPSGNGQNAPAGMQPPSGGAAQTPGQPGK